jgi:acyl carrier protein
VSDAVWEGIVEVARTEARYDGPLSPEQRLIQDLELDSLQLFSLAVAVEDRFRICLTEEDEQGLATLGDLAEVVRHKLTGVESDAG